MYPTASKQTIRSAASNRRNMAHLPVRTQSYAEGGGVDEGNPDPTPAAVDLSREERWRRGGRGAALCAPTMDADGDARAALRSTLTRRLRASTSRFHRERS